MNLKLRIKDLDCIDCARALEHVVRTIDGVEDVKISIAFSTLDIALGAGTDAKTVIRALRRKGYEVAPAEGEPVARAKSLKGIVSRRRIVLTSVSGALLVAALTLWVGHGPTALRHMLLLAAAVAALPLSLVRAVNALRSKSIDMNVLMTVAIAAAIAIRQWDEAGTVAFLFSIANILEALAMARTRRAIETLVNLSPDKALLKREGEAVPVDAETVRPGETIVVKPGERIPLEGRIISGETSVDESPITGESMPVTKGPGAEVFAGTLNEEGLIEIAVTKPKEESTLARIIHLVEHIAERKAPIERFVDRFASVYTPAVVIGAVALAVVPSLLGLPDGWIMRSLVLLIIACPCALVIATPVAVVSGLTSAARRGVLIKGGMYLEEAARIRAIAFDKTGTLTKGRPVVADVRPTPILSEEDLLRIAASLETASTHPLAGAVLAEARRRGIHWQDPEQVTAITGSGISGTIAGERYFAAKPEFFAQRVSRSNEMLARRGNGTTIAVGSESEILGVIEFADEVRPGAAETISALKKMGIARSIMITGDRDEVARDVARRLGIEDVHANLLPEEKVALVRDLRAAGGRVAMVGDGVNDAPALAASNLGIAMAAAGSDTAIETADAALMSDDIRRLVSLFGVSRNVARVTKQNLGFAIVVKAIFLSLGATGHATMWMAVFADMGASLIVIGNALRLLSGRAMGMHDLETGG
jgi:Cd2+/Zn2+-exporting ATPase